MAEAYYKVLHLNILMNPIVFNDLALTIIDFINVRHDDDWVSTYHKHPWFEFNYVSEGSLYTTMEQQEFLVNSESFYLIPPGVMHRHRHNNFDGDNGFCVRFRLEEVDIPEALSIRPKAAAVIDNFTNYQAKAFPFESNRLLSDIENVPTELMEAAFLYWLMSIYRTMYPEEQLVVDDWRHNQRNNVVKQVLLYLDEGYSSEINVNELADSVGYSYRHLARLFKSVTGTTIIEKLNSIRIAKSIHLLNNTDLSIYSICEQVGFHNVTYFSTIFAEYTHLSPSTFRKNHAQQMLQSKSHKSEYP